jgi:hypothetical protein
LLRLMRYVFGTVGARAELPVADDLLPEDLGVNGVELPRDGLCSLGSKATRHTWVDWARLCCWR